MRTRSLLALLVLAGALVVGLLLLPDGEGEEPRPLPGPAPDAGEVTDDSLAQGDTVLDVGDPGTRAEVHGEASDEPGGRVDEPGLPGSTTNVSVHGRVLDVTGAPLAGVPIVASSTPRRPLAESDGRGRFAFELAVVGGSATLTVPPGRWAPVRECRVLPESADAEQILVAAPAIDVRGRVEANDDTVLSGVRVAAYVNGAEVLHDFPQPLDRSRVPFRATFTDEAGRFALERIAAVRGATLSAHTKDYRSDVVPVPDASRDDLVLTLERVDAEEEFPPIEGVVLLPDRSPAAGATVRCGTIDVATDEEGRFSLEGGLLAADCALVAGKEGYGTVIDREFGALVLAWYPEPPPRITLVLADGPRAIAGRVVDAQGRPLAEWEVYVPEATALSVHQVPPLLAEEVAGGKLNARTGEDGKFRLTGLLDRSYVLRAYDPATLLAIESDPLPAGTLNALLVVPVDARHELLHGTVVARDGSPVAGVRVQVGMVLRRTEFGETSTTGARVLTDEKGEFTLPDVPRQGARLELSGDHVIPLKQDLGPDDGSDGLVLEVALRRHFRVVAKGRVVEGVGIELLDAGGASLPLYRFQAGSWQSTNRIQLEGGSTAVQSVSEDAVILRAVARGGRPDERELLRQAVYLDPEGVTEIVIELP